MKERMLSIGQRVWLQFKAFTPGQKVVALAAVGALAFGGYFLATWKQAATYAPLYTNLAPSDASAIVDKLNASGIPYQLGAGGTEVLVPEGQVYSTRLTMSSAGLPGSSQTGYSLLDKEGITTSQFKQQIDYQRAIEGELAKTIMSIGGVTAASVHLAIPQQNVFNDGSQKPTAAVLVTSGAANVLTSAQVQSIVYLVSSSVPGMTAADVTVSDSNGNVLKAPGQNGASGLADASTQNQAVQTFDNSLESKLQAKLDAVLGPGHSSVTVNSVLNFDRSATVTRSYINGNLPPVSESTSKETYQGAGANGAGGTLGTVDTSGTNAAGSGNGKYLKQTTTVNNSLGTKTQTIETAPGSVQNLSIAVALDQNVKGLNVTAIRQLLQSGSGYNAARGDSLSVQTLPFDTTTQQAATLASAAAAKAAAAATSQSQLMGYAKQGVLVLLVLGVLVATMIAGFKRRKAPAEPQDDLFDIDGADDDAAGNTGAPVTDLRAAAERRRNLVAAADERPEDVARVLSGWLNTKES